MTDFVLEKSKNAPIDDYNEVNEKFVNSVISYANFLKQPLTLGMFVPCDDDGVVLEIYKWVAPKDIIWVEYEKRLKIAQSKVLFNGFQIEQHETEIFSVRCENKILNVFWNMNDDSNWFTAKRINIVEDLIIYNLDLAVSF